MSRMTPGLDYGQLPSGQGKTERTWWALAVFGSFVPLIGILLSAPNGLVPEEEGIPTDALALCFTATIGALTVLQVLSVLRASRSLIADYYYLPGLRRAKNMVAPAGVPVLVGTAAFAVFMIAAYDFVQIFWFVLQTFAIGMASGTFGTVFWSRLRKFGKTLPRVNQAGWPAPAQGAQWQPPGRGTH